MVNLFENQWLSIPSPNVLTLVMATLFGAFALGSSLLLGVYLPENSWMALSAFIVTSVYLLGVTLALIRYLRLNSFLLVTLLLTALCVLLNLLCASYIVEVVEFGRVSLG